MESQYERLSCSAPMIVTPAPYDDPLTPTQNGIKIEGREMERPDP